MKSSLVLIGSLLIPTLAVAEPGFYQVNGEWHRSPHWCGTPAIPGAPSSQDKIAPAPGTTRTVFLNRNGGTYARAGATNSANNTQTVGNGTMVIPPFNATGFDWPALVACVKDHYKAFNVKFTETEPTTGDFIEAVVGGDGSELGQSIPGILGIASADNFCNVTERGIAFSFSESHRGISRQNEELCATIAHEIGHLIKLEHEQLGPDLMSYVPIASSGTKAFIDQNSPCGTDSQNPNPCSCGGSSTNSHARLELALGLRPTETVPPTLNVTGPGGDKLPPTFDVTATATDNLEMSDVAVLIDNVEVGNDTQPDGTNYKVAVKGIKDGQHMMTVVARDTAGNETPVTRAITIARAQPGESCVANEACASNLCIEVDAEKYCSVTCDLNAPNCPSDFECLAANSGAVCVLTGGGGCCGASLDPRASALMMFGVGALVLRRRRRK